MNVMSVYTVHEPPLRATTALPDAERFVFVRDGFYFWAFLVTVLWMLWHRMWLVLLIYVAGVAGVETALRYSGVSNFVLGIVALLISLLIGIEAGTLRRFTLARRGWKQVGVVSGDGLEAGEWRFFDAWIRATEEQRAESPAAFPAASPPPLPRPPQPPDVIGLFPEPGGTR
jgi:Protein of unknown function (DUF2628)